MTADQDPAETPLETPFAEAASPFVHTETPVSRQEPPKTERRPTVWETHRYLVEFCLAMLAYLMFLVGSVTILQSNPNASWRYYVALLPLLPTVFVLLIFVRSLSRLDELQKRIQMKAFGFSLGATALVTFGYGFLEGVGLPHLNWTYVLPLMAILWGVGAAYFTIRYR